MRIVLAGTPAFAVPSLRALAALGPPVELAAVLSQPDRPRGRSRTPEPPPVVAAARELGLPPERILQPESLNSPAALAALRALRPDLLCVLAYGAILKNEALRIPRLLGLNAHASLLPRHRGAAPIQAALLAGDETTGVSLMRMVRALDAGPILLRRELPLAPDETAGSLEVKLAALAAEALVEGIRRIEAGTAEFIPQDSVRATYAPKLAKESGILDWKREAAHLERLVRAMTPWPGAWSALSRPEGGARLRLRVARAGPPRPAEGLFPPGSAPGWTRTAPEAPESLLTLCGDGRCLPILAVQPEGRREMSAAEFLRGAGRLCSGGAMLGAG